jgi:hypothetical protein
MHGTELMRPVGLLTIGATPASHIQPALVSHRCDRVSDQTSRTCPNLRVGSVNLPCPAIGSWLTSYSENRKLQRMASTERDAS